MQFFFDHLIATFVGVTLTVALMTQQVNTRQAALERISVYSAKTQSLAFAEWLEDDVIKLGSRFGGARDRFTMASSAVGSARYTDRFEFYYNDAAKAGTVVERVEVRYVLEPDTDTRVVVERGATDADDVTVDLYRLRRSERRGDWDTAEDEVTGDPAGWIGTAPDWVVSADYATPAGLRHFQIQPLDSEGRPFDDTNAPDDYALRADYVRLQFTVVPTLFPLDKARIVPKEGLHWATTIELRPF